MAELIINTGLITLAIIGALYALGLIIVALIGPPTIDDVIIDACSSECDDFCAANDHCNAPDPWCTCKGCKP